MKYLIPLIFLCISDLGKATPCPDFTPSYQKQVDDASEVVFFASWCSSCLKSIHDSKVKDSVYIAIFDERKKAEEALAYALGKKIKDASCFFDGKQIVGKQFNVTNLPFVYKRKK